MSDENKVIIYRLIDEVWNQRKVDILDEIVAPDAVIHSTMVPDLSRGPEGAKQYVRLFSPKALVNAATASVACCVSTIENPRKVARSRICTERRV